MRQLFIYIIFGITLSILFSSGQIENPDTHLRLTQTRIILDEKKLSLPENVGENQHGNIAINEQGKRYMVYNPGQTITFIPIYFIANLFLHDEANAYYFTAFIASFFNYIIHALCAFLLFKIALLLGVTKKQAFLSSIFFGLTSYSFVFAQSTYEHHFEMFFILLSTYFAMNREIKHSGLLTGLMLSLGLIFRTTVILSLPAILLMQKEKNERLKTFLSLSIGIAFVLFYNYYRFGDPLESGYSLAWSLAHSNKFDFWSLSRTPLALFGFLFSPGKGLLFFSTTIIIAFVGLKQFWKQQRLIFYVIIIISATYLVVFSLNFAWHGSIWSFGPRYILPIIPFLYLPFIYVKPQKWVFITLILAFILQFELISVNYKRNVLSEYIEFKGISDLDYIFSLDNEPHLVQAKQLSIILPKNLSKLNDFMPNSPWKKEIRTASNEEVLNSSIEKNSVNFWWVRIFHSNSSIVIRGLTILILIFGIYCAYILFKYVKREFI